MAPRVLLIDNFDSFVYNLAQYLGASGAEPVVRRNDVAVAELEALEPDALLVSPGPGRPEDAGCSVGASPPPPGPPGAGRPRGPGWGVEAIRHFAGRVPVLGVCLGHQAIGVAFGGSVVRAGRVMHGKTSEIFHEGGGVFAGLRSEETPT